MEIERELLERLFERFLRLRARTLTDLEEGEWEALHVDDDWTDRELVETIALIVNAPD